MIEETLSGVIIMDKPKVRFRTDEISTIGLSDKKIGMTFKAIINFEVIERTKSFATLRLNHINLAEKKRTF